MKTQATPHLVIVSIVLIAAMLACNAPATSNGESIETLTPVIASQVPNTQPEPETTGTQAPGPTRTGPAPSRVDQVEQPEAVETTQDGNAGPPTITPTFNPSLPVYRGPSGAVFDRFQQTLVDTLSSGPRDYDELQTLIGGDVFLVTGVNIAERELAPADARRQLEDDLLPIRNTFSYSFGDDANIPALLGYDPQEAHPDAVYFLLTEGWLDGNADAILIVASNDGSGYRWAGVILDMDGFDAPDG